MLHFTGYKQWRRAIYFVSYMCYTVLHCYWHTMYHILLAAGCITQWWHMLMCCCVCLGQDVFLSCVLSQGSVDQVLMLFVVFLCSTEVYREDVFCVKHVTNALCCVVVFIYGRMCSCDLSCVLCQTSDHQDCRHNTTAACSSSQNFLLLTIASQIASPSIALREQIFLSWQCMLELLYSKLHFKLHFNYIKCHSWRFPNPLADCR